MKGDIESVRYSGVAEERLGIEVTTRCNIDCLHCFARAGISTPSSLSLELVKEIMAEGYDVGYRHLHITGGEPLLWEGLFEALDYAFDSGYQSVFLNTNGTLLAEDISGRLATYDGLSVSVSLEGTKALHDHLREKGSYTRTIQGIEGALDAGIELSVFTTACKSTLSELPHFARDLYKKFPSIEDLTLIQLIPVTNGVFPLSEELLEPEDFLQLIEIVSILNILGHTTRFLNNPLTYVASKLLKTLWILKSKSLISEGSLIVMANRDVGLSHSSRDSFGKYELGMIERVLASDEYRKAVGPDEKTCPSCKYVKLCMERGMDRPSEWYWDIQSDVFYCQRVLDIVEGHQSNHICKAFGMQFC